VRGQLPSRSAARLQSPAQLGALRAKAKAKPAAKTPPRSLRRGVSSSQAELQIASWPPALAAPLEPGTLARNTTPEHGCSSGGRPPSAASGFGFSPRGAGGGALSRGPSRGGSASALGSARVGGGAAPRPLGATPSHELSHACHQASAASARLFKALSHADLALAMARPHAESRRTGARPSIPRPGVAALWLARDQV
jgi:hypothetical protein